MMGWHRAAITHSADAKEQWRPGKLVDPFKPGEPGDHGAGIATDKVPAGFYEFLGFPCLLSTEAVRKAVARGRGDRPLRLRHRTPTAR